MKICEIITDKYKLRIPPTVYYELLADVQELEEEQEPTTKNDLGVDAVSRQEVLYLVGDYDLSMGQVVRGIHALPSVTPQEPIEPMVEIDLYSVIKQKYIEREVLDKIREEIKVMTSNRGFLSCSVEYIHKGIDNVFDKYKAESEKT